MHVDIYTSHMSTCNLRAHACRNWLRDDMPQPSFLFFWCVVALVLLLRLGGFEDIDELPTVLRPWFRVHPGYLDDFTFVCSKLRSGDPLVPLEGNFCFRHFVSGQCCPTSRAVRRRRQSMEQSRFVFEHQVLPLCPSKKKGI